MKRHRIGAQVETEALGRKVVSQGSELAVPGAPGEAAC